MYDGIKIECAISNKQKWNNSLELIGRHAEHSGEVMPLPSTAEKYGCTFSRQKTKSGNRYFFQGSVHKFYRKGKENDNDYTLAQFEETLDKLKNHGISINQSKVINFEFGLNITLPIGMDAQVYQKYLVSAHKKAFEKLNPKRPMVGYIAEFNEFNIKIYDKGYQAQTGATDQLRIEIKVNRTRWLDQFGFIKGKDLLLSDLLNPINIKILGDILHQKISSLILTPREVDIKKLSNRQQIQFYQIRDARSWEEWNSKQRERKRQQLAAIFKKLNQPNPVDVLAKLVDEKWRELTTIQGPEKDKQSVKNDVFSTLIVGGIRDILNFIFKIHECSYCSKQYSYLVYRPRGIPLPRIRQPDKPFIGFRWTDYNCRGPPIINKHAGTCTILACLKTF